MTHFVVTVVTAPADSSSPTIEELMAPYDEQREEGRFDDYPTKWDWWVAGGRWSDRLLRKDGSRCDSDLVANLDLLGMRDAGRAKGRAKLELLDRLVAQHGMPDREWVKLKRTDPEFDAARKAYWAHPTIKGLIPEGGFSASLDFDDLDWIEKSPEGWLEAQGALAVAGPCVLTHDGIWHEAGEHGWFGTSDATVGSTIGYLEHVTGYLLSLPGDYTITSVDAHV